MRYYPKMYNWLIFIVVVFFVGCKNDVQKNTLTRSVDTVSAVTDHFIDAELSDAEKIFLQKLNVENPEILIGAKMKRFMNGSKVLIYSRLVLPDKQLADLGYVYYNFVVWGNLEEEVEVSYSYCMGQANIVYGNVIGGSIDDYVHTRVGYGVSAKTVSVFNNGEAVSKTTFPFLHSDKESATGDQ